MSTEQSSSTQPTRSEAEMKRQAQSNQWREIGISAVAAAAQQTSDKRAAELKASGSTDRVVTIRDIEHFAS